MGKKPVPHSSEAPDTCTTNYSQSREGPQTLDKTVLQDGGLASVLLGPEQSLLHLE